MAPAKSQVSACAVPPAGTAITGSRMSVWKVSDAAVYFETAVKDCCGCATSVDIQ